MKSLCSVIVPTHNRRDRLMKTLTTIRTQSYEPLEIIIVIVAIPSSTS